MIRSFKWKCWFVLCRCGWSLNIASLSVSLFSLSCSHWMCHFSKPQRCLGILSELVPIIVTHKQFKSIFKYRNVTTVPPLWAPEKQLRLKKLEVSSIFLNIRKYPAQQEGLSDTVKSLTNMAILIWVSIWCEASLVPMRTDTIVDWTDSYWS